MNISVVVVVEEVGGDLAWTTARPASMNRTMIFIFNTISPRQLCQMKMVKK